MEYDSSISEEGCVGAEIFISLGQDHFEKNEYDESIKNYTKALDKYLSDYGEALPEIANTYSLLGKVYEVKQDFAKAEEYYKKSHTIYCDYYRDGIKVINSYFKLIDIIFKQGKEKIGEAREYSKEMLKIVPTDLDDELLDIGEYYESIGDLLVRLEEYNESLLFYNKTLHVYEKNLGDNDERLSLLRYKMGQCYISIKDWERSYASFEKSLSFYKNNWQPDKIEDVTDKFLEAAISLNNSERHHDAIKLLKYLLEVYPKDNEHPKLGEIFGIIGDILIILKDYREAAKYHKKSLNIYVKAFGPNDILVCRACNRLNLIYFKFGLLGQSFVFFKKMLTIGRKLFGSDDQKVIEAKGAIALFEQNSASFQELFPVESEN
jgi:Putative Zn-dependent protease, contains TPR repeats